jgi:hypothetical protein
MKNLVFAILMGVFFTSCGGSTTETTPVTVLFVANMFAIVKTSVVPLEIVLLQLEMESMFYVWKKVH